MRHLITQRRNERNDKQRLITSEKVSLTICFIEGIKMGLSRRQGASRQGAWDAKKKIPAPSERNYARGE